MYANDAGGASGGVQRNKKYCEDQVKTIVEQTKDAMNKLAENVCLAYLNEQPVIDQFKAKKTAVVGAASTTGSSVSKSTEDSYLPLFSIEINKIISAFITNKPVIESNLFLFENDIIKAFTNSLLFKHYDSINSIEKLKKKVRKIDD